MTKLFNKGGDGAGEIVRVLGLIDNDLDFTKWEPILPLGIRDLLAIIGMEPIPGLRGRAGDIGMRSTARSCSAG